MTITEPGTAVLVILSPTRGSGFCCVCGQPVYRFGWHVDLWDSGANKNANWHGACVIARQFWNAPSGEAAATPAGAALR